MKFCVIFGSDPYHIVQFMVRRGSLSPFCALLRHFRNCAFCRIPFNIFACLTETAFQRRTMRNISIFDAYLLTYLLTSLTINRTRRPLSWVRSKTRLSTPNRSYVSVRLQKFWRTLGPRPLRLGRTWLIPRNYAPPRTC